MISLQEHEGKVFNSMKTLFGKAFSEEGRTFWSWRIFGQYEEKVKSACTPMGAGFEGEEAAGYLFNENVTKGTPEL